MRPLTTCVFISALYVLSSCAQKTCENSSDILASSSDQSIRYKTELAEKLRSLPKGGLTYTFEGYKKEGERETILINVHGDSLCAKMSMLVNDWTKLGQVRKEVSGYRGAEIRGLKYDILQVGKGTTASYPSNDSKMMEDVFVYLDHEKLVD